MEKMEKVSQMMEKVSQIVQVEERAQSTSLQPLDEGGTEGTDGGVDDDLSSDKGVKTSGVRIKGKSSSSSSSGTSWSSGSHIDLASDRFLDIY